MVWWLVTCIWIIKVICFLNNRITILVFFQNHYQFWRSKYGYVLIEYIRLLYHLGVDNLLYFKILYDNIVKKFYVSCHAFSLIYYSCLAYPAWSTNFEVCKFVIALQYFIHLIKLHEKISLYTIVNIILAHF